MASRPYPDQLDPKAWQRWFAIEGNNLAWDLATATRTAEQDLEMLNAAHAAAFHWRQIGTPLNDIRAKMLLAEVHALLGHGALALVLAGEVAAYFTVHEAPDWEQAFVHVIQAHAAAVAGDRVLHATAFGRARQALAAIADAEDRAVVEKTFVLVPPPVAG
ncbi:MAG: hypothetical protein R3E84_20840 [Pseudomonadales bacterium]